MERERYQPSEENSKQHKRLGLSCTVELNHLHSTLLIYQKLSPNYEDYCTACYTDTVTTTGQC